MENWTWNFLKKLESKKQKDISEFQKTNNSNEEDDGSQRFKSIIEAPYFLLHVLKVFLQKERILTNDAYRLLDDKKLFETFKYAIKKYENKHDFSISQITQKQIHDHQ